MEDSFPELFDAKLPEIGEPNRRPKPELKHATPTSPAAAAAMDASVKLFQKTANGQNLVISPLSALAVLAMLQWGAAGETLEQLDALLGESPGELSTLFAGLFTEDKPSDEPKRMERDSKYAALFQLPDIPAPPPSKVDFANAIWIREDETLQINDSFLESQGAFTEIHKAPFTAETCQAVNGWCGDRTNGKIAHILDGFEEKDALVLLNALAFSAQWLEKYEDNDVRDRAFTTESGTKRTVAFLHSTENRYLYDDHAEGFIKPYSGNLYAFAALLPEEGLPLGDYIAGLTGERLYDILQGVKYPVETATPKFKFESGIDLGGVLKSLGVGDLFDPFRADLSGIGYSTKPDTNLCVGDFRQRAFIDLNEKGTEAAAVTFAMIECMTSCMPPEPKRVYLDRPFLYLIIDRQTSLPLFIGTVTDVGV